MNPTPQQQAIWSELQLGTSHLIVEARAGTGKTTTLVEAAKQLPKESKVLFSSFNKHIADALREKLPKSCNSSTLHSFGFKQLQNAIPTRLKIDKDKVKKIIAGMGIPDANNQVHNALKKMTAFSKAFLCDGTEDEYETLRYLAKRFEVEMPTDEALVFPHIQPVLELCAQKAWDDFVIDYDDMIWIPARYDITIQALDFIFVDEAQDLNYSQQRLVSRACPSGRMIFVGDRFQSIYGFRGADSDSMVTLERTLAGSERGVKSLSLTVTFRCPESHVALARTLVSDIEASPNAKIGQITYIAKNEDAVEKMMEGDMVICRTNAPLIEIAQQLKKAGRRVIISGGGLQDDLAKTILKLHNDDLENFIRELEEYRKKNTHQLEAAGQSSVAIHFNDTCDSLIALYKQSESMEDLQKKIKTMFKEIDEGTDTDNVVLLSSVHKVKGLEKNRVFIIRSDLMPHPKAAEDWQIQQERNLAYVAVTRAKNELIFVGEVSKLFPR